MLLDITFQSHLDELILNPMLFIPGRHISSWGELDAVSAPIAQETTC